MPVAVTRGDLQQSYRTIYTRRRERSRDGREADQHTRLLRRNVCQQISRETGCGPRADGESLSKGRWPPQSPFINLPLTTALAHNGRCTRPTTRSDASRWIVAALIDESAISGCLPRGNGIVSFQRRWWERDKIVLLRSGDIWVLTSLRKPLPV